jgi:hypothetical protein
MVPMKITADWDVKPNYLVSNKRFEEYGVILKTEGSTKLKEATHSPETPVLTGL